ncbi:MAG: 23S rRNA (adenine(2503)-C(2))-methyltransferase [Epulopiscium sp. Nele67-Bin001]|nr:MAG: 23S rRNA (adenine(2503)-C(2))-methyltransferase [Epulopiscium sp. Nele67-Bin001]
MNEIIGMDITELEGVMQLIGEPKYRAKQLFSWFHNKLIWDYNQMSNLSIGLRKKLVSSYEIAPIKMADKLVSSIDSTTKYLFELEDGNIIESVLMKYKHGNSVCISTQVGCRMGCKFCASTIDGLVRNLTVAEMLAQVYSIALDTKERVSNVVLMGSGEPLERLDITTKFIKLINMEEGQNIGTRHITVSTCGLVNSILELAQLKLQITLAISLHAACDDRRKQIMPIAKKYNIAQVLDACNVYTDITSRRVSFEYALIQNNNDSLEDAHALGRLLKGMLCHVNLIPVNTVNESGFICTTDEGIRKFYEVLKSYNIETTVRRTLGQDIDAACGQLRRRYLLEAKDRGEC